jgi:hypothetical protein
MARGGESNTEIPLNGFPLGDNRLQSGNQDQRQPAFVAAKAAHRQRSSENAPLCAGIGRVS